MVFSPAPPGGNASGALVATAAGQAVKVVDLASGRELLSHEQGYDVVSFAFSPDGKRVAAGGRSNNPTVWDVVTGQTVYTVTTSAATGCVGGGLEATAFSPDGKRLALGPCILDAITGERLFTLLGHTGSISRLAFSADRTRLITASYDGTVKVWDLAAS